MDTATTTPSVHAPAPAAHADAPVTNAPVVPAHIVAKQKQASWGAIIIIVLILAMIVVGAFYAWGQRIAQTQSPATTSGASY